MWGSTLDHHEFHVVNIVPIGKSSIPGGRPGWWNRSQSRYSSDAVNPETIPLTGGGVCNMVYVCMYVCVYACMHACMHVCMELYVYYYIL